MTCARVFVLSPCVSLCSSVRDSLPRFAGEKAKSTAVYSISLWVSYLPTNTDTVSLSLRLRCVCVCLRKVIERGWWVVRYQHYGIIGLIAS